MKAKQTISEIARLLGRHRSTISREVRRGYGQRGYHAEQACDRAQESETQQSSSSSQVAKSLAASALSQRSGDKQTGAKTEDKAARVLASDRYAKETKELAASVLSQANKQL